MAESLRRVWPPSLRTRTVTLTALIVAFSHVLGLTIYVAVDAADLSSNREQLVADQLVTLTRLFESLPPELRQGTASELSDYSLQLSIDDAPRVVGDDAWASDAVELRRLLGFAVGTAPNQGILADYREVTGDDLGQVVAEDMPERAVLASRISALFRFRQDLLVSIHLKGGQWLNALAPGPTLASFTDTSVLLSIMLMVVLTVALLSWLIGRPLAAIARMVQRAEDLETSEGSAPLREDGPKEVRRLARAFNAMRKRIQTLMDERAHMIMAMTEDLPAPLDRMRLRAQYVGNERERRQMLRDIDDMESKVRSLGQLNRQGLSDQPRFRVDLGRMLEDLAQDFDLPAPQLHLHGVPELQYVCAPTAMRQAFAHLFTNAVTYGHSARICVDLRPDCLLVLIDDEGPGLPDEEREKVFMPFYRLEPSRIRNPGGFGLGLWMAREIIRAHGGDITLVARPARSGNCVRVSLPMASVATSGEI